MIIYPAIDLRAGRVVRLRQGSPEAETPYEDEPVAAAERWQAAGAEWLHVVNLDGAFGAGEGSALNRRRLRQIVAAIRVPVQFGGGLRSMADIACAFDLGVRRVVLGTVAVEQPDVLAEAIARYGADRVIVSIDARRGMVAVRGWQENSGLAAEVFAQRLAAAGVIRTVYTDIERDGMLAGPDLEGTARLARTSGLGIIASGGVSTLADIRALAAYEGVEGAIVGQALYTGALDLAAACAAGRE